MAIQIKVNVGGVWKDVVSVKGNVGSVWKDTSNIYSNNSSVWRPHIVSIGSVDATVTFLDTSVDFPDGDFS